MSRVVFVNHLPQGSASSYRQAGFAKCLREDGVETVLVCRSRKQRPPDDTAGRGRRPFDRTLCWDEPFPFRMASNLRVLSEAVREADVVHINRANPYTATILSLVRRSSRAALVVDMEDWDGYGGYSSYIGSYGPKGWALTFYEKTFPLTADAVVVVSRLLKSYMLSLGVPERKVSVIHNGFDGELFGRKLDVGSTRERLGLGDSPVVMYSSTFWEFERAQHEAAFSALGLISKEVPEARFLLTGKEESSVAQAIDASGVRGRVVRPGFVPREEFPQVMAAADVALHIITRHPFHAASSPMIVPEYMAMGKPVVAPAIGELTELLGGGAGVLVSDGDPGSLAAAAVRLLRDRDLRRGVGEAARRKAWERYSYEAATGVLKRAYRGAVMSRGRGTRFP